MLREAIPHPRRTESQRERSLGASDPSGRLSGRFRLRQSKPRMIEKGVAGCGQLNAMRAAFQQRSADLGFQILDLTAQRRLSRVEATLRRNRHAPCVGDGDEIPEVR